MPELSRFYGIIIKMYFLSNEHNPPHIHVFYDENVAVFDIYNANKIEGKIPIRAEKLVKEWILIHREEIIKIWKTQKFKKIEPLK